MLLHEPGGIGHRNALGPIRQIVQGETDAPRRYLVITAGPANRYGAPIQIQAALPGS